MKLFSMLFIAFLIGCGQNQQPTQPAKPKAKKPAVKKEEDPCGATFAKFKSHVNAYSKTSERAAKGNAEARNKTQSMLMEVQKAQWKVAKLQKDGKLNKKCEKEFSKLQSSLGKAVSTATKAPPPPPKGKEKKGDEKELTCTQKCAAMKGGAITKLACQNKCDAMAKEKEK